MDSPRSKFFEKEIFPVALKAFFGCSQTAWWCNNHLEKYELVNGKDDIPYMKWKIKVMFETTNQ
jgi:hypothetical protein